MKMDQVFSSSLTLQSGSNITIELNLVNGSFSVNLRNLVEHTFGEEDTEYLFSLTLAELEFIALDTDDDCIEFVSFHMDIKRKLCFKRSSISLLQYMFIVYDKPSPTPQFFYLHEEYRTAFKSMAASALCIANNCLHKSD